MCGLAGIVGGSFSLDRFKCTLNRMGDVIAHRGPDDFGTWLDPGACVGLVHRRLSIVDLSPAGHQPMISASGRFVLVFNGEIYNHLELRSGVQDSKLKTEWRGHSDTETLLAGFDVWGIEETLRRSVGMFAIAVWDRQRRALVLARDRLGEKPLYYGYMAGALAFGSELKALLQVQGFTPAINRAALALFMRHNYVPAPYTIYQGVAKLPPATWLEFTADAVQRRSWPEPQAYWSAREAAAQGIACPLAFGSDTEAAEFAGSHVGAGNSGPDGSRRSGGRLSFRRRRFVHGGCLDAKAIEPACENLHHWLQRGCLQRSGVRQARRPAPGHGAYGTLRVSPRGAECDSKAA